MFRLTRSRFFQINYFRRKYFSLSCKMSASKKERDIRQFFFDAVESVNPAKIVRKNVNVKFDTKTLEICNKTYNFHGNVYVVGFGKAVYLMAYECEQILGKIIKKGVISVPMGTLNKYSNDGPKLNKFKVYEAAENNFPDEYSVNASIQITELAKSLQEDDVLIVLLSGGGSALYSIPVPDILLEDKVFTIKLLQSVGADITELNTVRKQLSCGKGGGLAEAAYPSKVISLILSDVVNDPLDIIASGPTVPNTDSKLAAFEVIQKYRLDFKLPRHIIKSIQAEKQVLDIPKNRRQYLHVDNFVIGNNSIALNEIEKCSKLYNYAFIKMSSEIEGYVHNVSKFYSLLCLKICKLLNTKDFSDFRITFSDLRAKIPQMFNLQPNFQQELFVMCETFYKTNGLCLVAGGETTVNINGNGKGGRNQELALWFSQAMEEVYNTNSCMKDFEVLFLSAGTDGIDGPTDVAGAIGGKMIMDFANAQKLNVDEFLAQNDSYKFYSEIANGNFFVKTGHTGTNVMDVHIILITKKNNKSSL